VQSGGYDLGVIQQQQRARRQQRDNFTKMRVVATSAKPVQDQQACAVAPLCRPRRDLLRRQVMRPFRKPLAVMTPKSLLRHPEVVSNLDEFANGQFQRVIPEVLPAVAPDKVKKVLFCSGKIYYELRRQREALKRDDVAIIRLEELYPLSEALLHEVFGFYAEGTPVVWVQEEPENMGAWRYLHDKYCAKFLGRHPFSLVSRAASASPATGSASTHKREQELIINQAFA
jgi:2-oxoglutarate dehydrogenase E1 component